MDEKKHGLADNQDGEFILNESGTSVSTSDAEGSDASTGNPVKEKKPDEKRKSSSGPEEKDITD